MNLFPNLQVGRVLENLALSSLSIDSENVGPPRWSYAVEKGSFSTYGDSIAFCACGEGVPVRAPAARRRPTAQSRRWHPAPERRQAGPASPRPACKARVFRADKRSIGARIAGRKALAASVPFLAAKKVA